MLTRSCLPLVLFLCGLPSAEASFLKPEPPRLEARGNAGKAETLPLEANEVHVEVSGVIADVTWTQVYRNRSSVPIHARYVFPGSTQAAVHGLTMRLDNRVIKAKLKPKKEAKKVFEAAKKAGKSASLLEQKRPNVFQMNVANILPGEAIHVELSYSELLVPEEGTYELVIPAVVGPRYEGRAGEKIMLPDQTHKVLTSQRDPHSREGPQPYRFKVEGTVRAPVSIQDWTFPQSPAVSTRTGAQSFSFRLDGQGAGDRDFILRYRLSQDQVVSGLMLEEGEDENFFLLMMQPPRTPSNEDIPPREFVFVLDVSGSMYGFPLDTAKSLLRRLVQDLRPVDSFNILTFAGISQTLFPAAVSATQNNVDRAIARLDSLQGGGSTQLLSALRHAMELPLGRAKSRSFVILTDGYVSVEQSAFDYVRSNLGAANFFAFGIGTSVNRFLIEGLAHVGKGAHFVATSSKEAVEVSARFRRYIQSPVLTDIRVDFAGFEAYDVEPASVPDVLAERPVLVFGKWRGKPSGHVRLTGVTGQASKNYKSSFNVAKAERVRGAGLRHLWARDRIAQLSEYRLNSLAKDEKQKVMDLGLRYELLTPFTSFVAVDERVRAQGPGEDVTQPLPLPAGVSALETVGATYASGDEPPLVWLAACLLLGMGLSWSRRVRA